MAEVALTRELVESRMREEVAKERASDAKAPADKQKELRAIRRETLRVMQKTAASCWRIVAKREEAIDWDTKTLGLDIKMLGLRLLEVKVRMPHGAFKAWWRQEGMTQARVSYAMRIAFGKVKAAKEKREASPRTKALRDVGNLLARLYDMGQRPAKDAAALAEFRERMEKVYEKIMALVRQRFIAENWPTPTRQPVRAEGKTKPEAKAARA